MPECRVGQICDSSALITGAAAPLLLMATDAGRERQRASEYVANGSYTECLRLRDDYENTRRLLPVLAVGTAALGVTTLWAELSTSEAEAAPSAPVPSAPEPGKIGAIVAGIFTAAVGGWGAHEHWHYLKLPGAYARMNCEEVLRTVNETRSEPLVRPQKFQETETCSGVDILVGDCVPQRRLSGEYEWSTEPVAEPVAKPVTEPYRRGWIDRLGSVAMAGAALVGLAWVLGNDLHPAGSGDDHMIPVYWSRFLQSARFVFN